MAKPKVPSKEVRKFAHGKSNKKAARRTERRKSKACLHNRARLSDPCKSCGALITV